MEEENRLDAMIAIEKLRGCIGRNTDRKVELYECEKCPPMRRVNCPKPKDFVSRYGFENYQEMKEA